MGTAYGNEVRFTTLRHNTPPDTIPTDTVPTDTVPTDTIPTDTVPTDTIPTDTVPTDTIPTDTITTDTTGIMLYKTANLRIYPNPTTGTVTIELSTETATQKPEIQVFDVYGRALQVVNDADARGASLQTVEIDLSRYPTGIYLIKVIDNGKVMDVGKVLKQ